MSIETTHAREVRKGETDKETEAKVPESVTAKAAVDQLIKATRKVVQRHGLADV